MLGSLHILLRNTSPADASLVKLQRAFDSLPDTDTLTRETLHARAEFIEVATHPSTSLGEAFSARIMRPLQTGDTRAQLAGYDEALALTTAWFLDMIAVADEVPSHLRNVDRLVELQGLAAGREPARARRAAELAMATRRRLEVNVSEELALEALFHRVAAIFSAP